MRDTLKANYNMGQDRDLEDSRVRNDIKLKEKNQVTSANLREPTKVNGNHSSLSHRVFIGLFTVLFLSVIVLSFSLYRLDQKLTELKDSQLNHPSRDVISNKSPEENMESNRRKIMRRLLAWKNNVTQELKKITEDVKSMKDGREEIEWHIKRLISKVFSIDEQIMKLGSKVFQIEHVLNRIDRVNATTADLKSSLIALQAWQKEAKNELKKKGELITQLQGLLNSAQTGIDEEKKTVADLTKVVNTNKDTIKEKSDLITGLQTESAKSAEDIKDVNTYADQLRMKIQFDEKMEKELQLDFKKIVELAGMKDRVSQTDPTLKKLQDQKTSFEEANKKWKITYNDILRLISEEDFKQKELPVVKKIGTMFDLFTNTYNKKWGIEFKDVIKFTQKSDLTDMDLAGNKYLFNTAPKVLLKIDHLYNVFTEKYEPKWHISFKDVFSVTANLDFEVGATDIPVLTMIGSWFVENFNEIWGEKIFKDLFHELVKSSEDERKDIVAKLGKVAQKNSLHFLPADFEMTDKIITLSGFVKVLVNKVWGTIYKKGFKTENLAYVVCVQSGYKKGKVLKDYPQEGSYDRTNVIRLVRSAACYGNEENINECGQLQFDNTTTAWNQTDDLAIKCTL